MNDQDTKPSEECKEQTYMVEIWSSDQWIRQGRQFKNSTQASLFADASFPNGTKFRILRLVYEVRGYGTVEK